MSGREPRWYYKGDRGERAFETGTLGRIYVELDKLSEFYRRYNAHIQHPHVIDTQIKLRPSSGHIDPGGLFQLERVHDRGRVAPQFQYNMLYMRIH